MADFTESRRPELSPFWDASEPSNSADRPNLEPRLVLVVDREAQKPPRIIEEYVALLLRAEELC